MTLWLVRSETGQMAQGRINADTMPCPTIMAEGLGGNCSQYWLEEDSTFMNVAITEKPPYRVPSMQDIAAIPWNGLTVASTFSGCGGSCLGYRMAGFKVLWANEFVPMAQESYRPNAAPDCYLDCRDIHQIQPEDILQSTGLQVGELDLLDGSPPCQAFSTAGKREKGWGTEKTYEHGAKQKNETLFTEYIRLLRGLIPKTFVAENVSGLVKGTAKGYFKEILAALKASGYRVESRLLDAQWLGVPQMRQRIIFIGVRHDLGKAPVFPRPLPYQYSVREVLPWISTVSNLLSGKQPGMQSASRPCPTVMTGGTGGARPHSVEAETDISRYAIGREWDILNPGEKSTKYRNLVKPGLDRPCETVTCPSGGISATSVVHQTEKRKFTIAELKRICAFPDDFVLTGSYAQQWARLGNAVPPVMMFHIAKMIHQTIFDT